MGFNKKFFTTGGIVASSPTADEANFNTVLYTGNSTNDQSVTGVGFQPDFVWIKGRNVTASGTAYHGLWDSVRGISSGQLSSSLTSAEFTCCPNRLYSFNSDGFSLGNGVDPEYIGDRDYVAWCWKAAGYANTFNVLENGSTTSSATAAGAGITAGSITTGWSVSANRDAGFSIVSFTSNGAASVVSTGHGLSVEPEMVIFKNRDNSSYWLTYHKDIGDNGYLALQDTFGTQPFTPFFDMTSTTIAVRQSSLASNNEKCIAYCFHSVDGYQKIGSYSGSGSAGNKQTTGFQPRFVMLKAYSGGTSGWFIFDSERSGEKRLAANTSSAESDETNHGINFESDGFSFDAADANNSGINWIYLAIA